MEGPEEYKQPVVYRYVLQWHQPILIPPSPQAIEISNWLGAQDREYHSVKRRDS
jgi:hypothetical protein